jgi:hypothetical protein
MTAKQPRDSVLWLEYALLSCLLFLFFFRATQAAWTQADAVEAPAEVPLTAGVLEFNAERLGVLTDLDGDENSAAPVMAERENGRAPARRTPPLRENE